MSTTSKLELLRTDAKRAIDAIVHDTDLDDDTKEEIFEDIQEYIEDCQKLLGDGDDEDEDEDGGDIEDGDGFYDGE